MSLQSDVASCTSHPAFSLSCSCLTTINNKLKQQGAARIPKLSQFCRNFCVHTSLKPRVISLKPRVHFPQTTSTFPSNHEYISLKPRVHFPQTTCRFPSNHVPISLKPRISCRQLSSAGKPRV